MVPKSAEQESVIFGLSVVQTFPIVSCVGGVYLQVEERVKVRDDDMPVFHLAPHVFNGVDGGLVVGLRAASRWETLQPHAARLTQLIKDQTSQFHCLDLCSGPHTSHIRHMFQF